MDETKMGELTLKAYDTMWELSSCSAFYYEDEIKDKLVNFLKKKDNFVDFSKELFKIVKSKSPGVNDKESALDYLVSKAKETGAIIERNTLKNWITGESNPQGNSASRKNIYKLCFLLNMDYKQTCDFFTKIYMDRPFDFRKKEEVIYAFCLNKNMDYRTATSLIENMVDNTNCSSDKKYEHTYLIGEDILSITDVDKLLNYIGENSVNFTENNASSIATVKKFMKDCKKNIKKNQGGKISVDDVLCEIYGDSLSAKRKENKTIKKNAAFLNVVKMNFPEKQLYNQIENGTASYHTIRKFLILLHFYTFFSAENQDYADFDNYRAEANDMLQECGYNSMYYRNPYDWMFLYCAVCDSPIEEFSSIMNIMFFDCV